MTTESKDFVKYDVGIAIAYLCYTIYELTKIDIDYSSDYKSIFTFFLLFNLVAILMQVLLIVFSIKQNPSWLLTIRSCAFLYLLGSAIIFTSIGLLNFFFIIIFFTAGAFHCILMFDTMQLPVRNTAPRRNVVAMRRA